jgi:hypothetical protein
MGALPSFSKYTIILTQDRDKNGSMSCIQKNMITSSFQYKISSLLTSRTSLAIQNMSISQTSHMPFERRRLSYLHKNIRSYPINGDPLFSPRSIKISYSYNQIANDETHILFDLYQNLLPYLEGNSNLSIGGHIIVSWKIPNHLHMSPKSF